MFQGDVIKHGHAYKGTVATESGEEVGFKIIFVIPLSKLLDERYASSDVELTEKKSPAEIRRFLYLEIRRKGKEEEISDVEYLSFMEIICPEIFKNFRRYSWLHKMVKS